MSNSALNETTLADVHHLMQVLKKYSDSQIVQKILKECFDNSSKIDTERSDSVPRAISPPFPKEDEIVYE
jgi:hypothetical protein